MAGNKNGQKIFKILINTDDDDEQCVKKNDNNNIESHKNNQKLDSFNSYRPIEKKPSNAK